jgi:hypothetical protein
MNSKIPVYKLEIDETSADETGVNFVALVDVPATMRNWIAFGGRQYQALNFQVTNAEQRVISGPLMVAGLPIYRKDDIHGEHYVIFDKLTIQQIVQKFFRNGNTGQVNLMHEANAHPSGVYMFESFIIDSARGIKTPKGFSTLPDGSWFASYKVDNDMVWAEFIKSGTFKGFSVEGIFIYSNPVSKEEHALRQIEQLVDGLSL